jgi:glycosyltransferase involved in cell wall biosynthesis
MKFSIIIATYNSEPTISRCLSSLINQTYQDFEIIIFDKLSHDRTIQIVKKYQKKDKRIKFFSEDDINHYDAFNKAVKESRGDWIYILGSDDFLTDNNVLKDVSIMLDHKKSYIFYGKVNLINKDKQFIDVVGGTWDKVGHNFFSFMSIPHQGVFHYKLLFIKYGYFNTSFSYAGDYELILRYLKDNKPFFINRIIANYSNYGGSSIYKNIKKVFFEWRKAQKLNSIPFSFRWMFGLFKFLIIKK